MNVPVGPRHGGGVCTASPLESFLFRQVGSGDGWRPRSLAFASVTVWEAATLAGAWRRPLSLHAPAKEPTSSEQLLPIWQGSAMPGAPSRLDTTNMGQLHCVWAQRPSSDSNRRTLQAPHLALLATLGVIGTTRYAARAARSARLLMHAPRPLPSVASTRRELTAVLIARRPMLSTSSAATPCCTRSRLGRGVPRQTKMRGSKLK